MIKEKADYTEMWKTGYTKEKPKENIKLRNCMTCNNIFKSTWNGNRVCYTCKNSDNWYHGNDYSIMRQS